MPQTPDETPDLSRRSARLAVNQVLAQAATLTEAAPRILRAVCGSLGWDVGALWMVDQRANVLRFQELWHIPSIQANAFAQGCRHQTFAPGTGLPGRVWQSGKPAWIPDVAQDSNFPRASNALQEGLHGAFGAPVLSGPEVLGVIEFFSRKIREPDSDLLEMMATIGSQIGQFLERQGADDRLRWLAAIVASSDDAIISKNLDGIILSWNEGAERLYGYTAEEIVGRPLALLVPPDHPDELPAIMERLKRGERIEHFETVRVSKDGRRIDVSLTISPVKNAEGRIIGASKIARDITRQKHAQQTTRFLADASATLTELTDYESTLRRVARLAVPQFADWCAVDLQRPDGSIRRLAIVHADPAKVQCAQKLFDRWPPRPTDRHGVMAALRRGEPNWAAMIPDTLLADLAHDEEHLRILRELGLKSYLCVPLRSRDQILGVLTFATAESGRVYDAGDLRAADDLAGRIAIAIENARLLAALKEADRRKDEFLAILAHELRNPLAPLRSAAHLLQQPGLDRPALERTGEMMGRQVQQLGRLVDDLLDLSRIARGKMDLRKEWVDLRVVVRRAADVSRSLIESRRHHLTVSLPDAPVPLRADPTRLEQVLTNLLNNAARYTPEGGHIWLTAAVEGGEAVVRVRDTGIGIPPEMLSRIFGLFAQVERREERSQGGLGIGLSLVKSLTEMHGGRAVAHSPGPGRGSEFVVYLPLGWEETPIEAPPESAPAPERALRVLLVDDNVDAAESLAMLLRLWGHEVTVAHDGPAAVQAAAGQCPEVALLDIGLPGMDGYELARQLRAQPALDQTVLVALTGWGQEEDRRRSQEAGFNYHLVKPVDLSALQELLAQSQPQQSAT
jgi:PAS domain S-box-containing protein